VSEKYYGKDREPLDPQQVKREAETPVEGVEKTSGQRSFKEASLLTFIRGSGRSYLSSRNLKRRGGGNQKVDKFIDAVMSTLKVSGREHRGSRILSTWKWKCSRVKKGERKDDS